MLDEHYPKVRPGAPRPSKIIMPGQFALPEGTERYVIEGGGAGSPWNLLASAAGALALQKTICSRPEVSSPFGVGSHLRRVPWCERNIQDPTTHRTCHGPASRQGGGGEATVSAGASGPSGTS